MKPDSDVIASTKELSFIIPIEELKLEKIENSRFLQRFIIPIEELKLICDRFYNCLIQFIIPIEELKQQDRRYNFKEWFIYNTYWGIET